MGSYVSIFKHFNNFICFGFFRLCPKLNKPASKVQLNVPYVICLICTKKNKEWGGGGIMLDNFLASGSDLMTEREKFVFVIPGFLD